MDSRNIKALISAVLAFFGFMFLPWLGRSLQSAGSMLFANTLFNTVGAQQDPLIWLVLVAVTVGLLAPLYGIFNPRYGGHTPWIALAAGCLGLAYFARMLLAGPAWSVFGLGFWVTLLGCLGLVVQILPEPATLPFRPATRSRPASSKRAARRAQLTPYLFLLPGLLLYTFWVLYPMLYSFYMSFLRWDFVSPAVWVGFANYVALWKDPNFALAIKNNLLWLMMFLVVPTTFGLLLAMLLNQELAGNNVFKIVFFLPYVLSFPVIGLVWAWVFNPAMGLVNPVLGALGVHPLPGWLADRSLAIWVIITAASWRQVGYVMILYLAGLKSIDPQLLEAAQLDGANRWQSFARVVFPLLTPVTVIVVVISVIDSLRAFDLVSIMTRGGQDTQVMANLMYMETFNNYKMGYGASIAVVLTLITGLFIYAYLVRVRQQEIEY